MILYLDHQEIFFFFFWWGAGKCSVGLRGQREDRGVGLHHVFVQAQGMSSCKKKKNEKERRKNEKRIIRSLEWSRKHLRSSAP